MILKSILAGQFKLDGGAMYGVVPKKIWNKLNPADENNLCTWALRCLYIAYPNKKILIDTGMGDKQDPKFFSHYSLSGDTLISQALLKNGIDPEDITDIIFSHLHFDHCGGAFTINSETKISTAVFKNAKHWVHREQWELAIKPNAREKASFLSENISPLIDQNLLYFLDEKNSPFEFIEFLKVNGHSQGMLLPIIQYRHKSLLFCADLYPSVSHLPLPYVMAYDMQPLITLQEKQDISEWAVANNVALFFEHDPVNEVAVLKKNEGGKIIAERAMGLEEWKGGK